MMSASRWSTAFALGFAVGFSIVFGAFADPTARSSGDERSFYGRYGFSWQLPGNRTFEGRTYVEMWSMGRTNRTLLIAPSGQRTILTRQTLAGEHPEILTRIEDDDSGWWWQWVQQLPIQAESFERFYIELRDDAAQGRPVEHRLQVRGGPEIEIRTPLDVFGSGALDSVKAELTAKGFRAAFEEAPEGLASTLAQLERQASIEEATESPTKVSEWADALDLLAWLLGPGDASQEAAGVSPQLSETVEPQRSSWNPELDQEDIDFLSRFDQVDPFDPLRGYRRIDRP